MWATTNSRWWIVWAQFTFPVFAHIIRVAEIFESDLRQGSTLDGHCTDVI